VAVAHRSFFDGGGINAAIAEGWRGAVGTSVADGGLRKRFRVRLDRIVSFEPYSDGIGIMRDAQSAKPQMFSVGDGWFIYNPVSNIYRL
jgi:hypothetical protein